mmetsp:Transcript_101312/g.218718  ORF Transcript_101312/g.218718 Transcript_101312/m.218718 type:complete len:105 (-) Transcript_101312:15-329(-)
MGEKTLKRPVLILELALELAPERDCLTVLTAPPTARITPCILRDELLVVLLHPLVLVRLPARERGGVTGVSHPMLLKSTASSDVGMMGVTFMIDSKNHRSSHNA